MSACCDRKRGDGNLRWRIRKKKGLLKDPVYEKVKGKLFWEIEEEARRLERRAGWIRIPEEGEEGRCDGRCDGRSLDGEIPEKH